MELRVAKYAEGEDSIVYDIGVKRVFSHLQNKDLAKMQDPTGISGYISPCSTTAQLEDAKSRLSTALPRAQKACDAKDADDMAEAFKWWDLVYAGNFPSYYF